METNSTQPLSSKTCQNFNGNNHKTCLEVACEMVSRCFKYSNISKCVIVFVYIISHLSPEELEVSQVGCVCDDLRSYQSTSGYQIFLLIRRMITDICNSYSAVPQEMKTPCLKIQCLQKQAFKKPLTPFKNIQFCGINHIRIVEQPSTLFIFRNFSSFQTETQYPVNSNSLFSPPFCPW